MRPVDADFLLEKSYWLGERPTVDCLYTEGAEVVNATDIENAPVLDVALIIHAHWIYKRFEDDPDLYLYHCSNCSNLSARPRAYCAECGAKMEEKVEIL